MRRPNNWLRHVKIARSARIYVAMSVAQLRATAERRNLNIIPLTTADAASSADPEVEAVVRALCVGSRAR